MLSVAFNCAKAVGFCTQIAMLLVLSSLINGPLLSLFVYLLIAFRRTDDDFFWRPSSSYLSLLRSQGFDHTVPSWQPLSPVFEHCGVSLLHILVQLHSEYHIGLLHLKLSDLGHANLLSSDSAWSEPAVPLVSISFVFVMITSLVETCPDTIRWLDRSDALQVRILGMGVSQ